MSKTLDELMALVEDMTDSAFYCEQDNAAGINALEAAEITLRARLAAIVADAERYAFLREQPDNTEAPRIDVVQWVQVDESANEGTGLRGEALDNAIDAARNQTKEPQ
jgi:hypothetical protein